MKGKGKSRARVVFLLFLFFIGAITVLTTFWRLHFGVDLTDESFYVVCAHRFALGARPFFEELEMHQTAFILLALPVKAYLLFANGLEGIALYLRYLYFIFQLILFFLLYRVLKNFLQRELSFLIALTCLAFAPFNIPNLNNNTLGSGLLTLGLFLGLFFILKQDFWLSLFLSGLSLALAAVSYPTLILIGLIYPLFLLFLVKEKKTFFFYYAGLSLPFILLIPLLMGFLGVRLSDLQLSLSYTVSSGQHTASLDFLRLGKVFTSIFANWPYPIFLPAFLLAGLFSQKLKNYFTYLMFAFPLLPLFPTGFKPHILSLRYVFYFSLLYPLLYFLIRKNGRNKVLFFSVWLPSLIAGITTAYTSSAAYTISDGYRSAGVGAFPGALIALLYLALVLDEGIKLRGSFSAFEPFLKSFPLVLVLAILLFFQLNAVYRDDPLHLLKVRIESGGFSGIYTSKAKSEYLFELTEDLKKNCSKKDTIFFYDRFPGGYLLTEAVPLTNTIWVHNALKHPKAKRELIVDYFKKGRKPSVVVRVKILFNSAKNKEKMAYLANDVIDNFFKKQGYRLVVNKECYEIYRRPDL